MQPSSLPYPFIDAGQILTDYLVRIQKEGKVNDVWPCSFGFPLPKGSAQERLGEPGDHRTIQLLCTLSRGVFKALSKPRYWQERPPGIQYAYTKRRSVRDAIVVQLTNMWRATKLRLSSILDLEDLEKSLRNQVEKSSN